MNYTKIYNVYNALIEKARQRVLDIYTESHHIIPRCMGGSDDLSNLVNLTPEEHYVAHQLLVKMYPNNASLVFAAHMMGCTRSTNKLYGWLRRKYSEEKSKTLKGKPPNNKGKKLSEETKRKIGIASSKRKHSEETKKKISESHIGNQYGVGNKSRTGQKQSDEEKRKKSIALRGENNPNYGVKYTAERKEQIRMAMLNRPKKECPHCHRLFDPTNYSRYHNENCKLKQF